MTLEEEIVCLLHQKIGFNPASIGSDKILSAVRARLCGQRIVNPEQFLQELRHGSPEFQNIIDAVVIPETWFFRDGEPFELLKRFAREWWRKAGGSTLQCLSLPCSTGEEPYSIAMNLLDAGLAPEQFKIDGVDISPKSLERARRGVYTAYSFRSADISFRDRYFETVGAEYRLRSDIRESVRFSQGNMLDADFMNDGRQYDIVFCRNLLIYFDPPCWTQAIKTLTRLLKDTGLLFMGHAEMLELSAPEFESVRFPSGFAYRKRKASSSVAALAAVAPMRRRIEPVAARSRPILRKEINTLKPAPTTKIAPKRAAPKDFDRLQKASSLADAGKFPEAATECEQQLAADPGCAQAYFLLGLIHQAQQKPRDAEGFYNRALYLDSRHHEAMVHLALLLEGRGDKPAAEAMRRRAARARASS
jgi:chemotaxis protein methyltransferase WspC